MAQASELSKADNILRITRLVIEDLDRAQEDWDTWDEDIQADFTFEWMGVMDHLFYVRDQVAEGAATPEQTAAYRQIQADLRAAVPILRTLELHVPPELLRELTPPTERRVSA
jgi:hypothetical protein